ncbi:MAG: NAD(P)/FAD-dependent oxidoreductase [Woeseiaceae bacterium]
MQQFDVIVLGGGAAGLMCALTAGERGKRVLVLEGANKIGKKILMSGGGRCNFTNLYCEPDRFLSSNPHFCKSALRRYTQWDFIALVDKHQIPYHEKTLGQLFCDRSSKDIVAMLRAECESHGVRILMDCRIDNVEKQATFAVKTTAGHFQGDALVVATGGLSIPKMGASDFGYRLARQFGHDIIPTRAGLVPFTFTGALHDMMTRLSGVSVPAAVSAGAASFREGLLFTHRGLSGPAPLQASSYWHPGESINIDLLPDLTAAEWLVREKRAQPRRKLLSILQDVLPKALAQELDHSALNKDTDVSIADMTDDSLDNLGRWLNEWQVKPAATEGYRTAEVTLGGVDTAAVSSKTMESEHTPGLFFIGEVLDVTGHLGGFNFQWAWSSAVAAANHV